MNLWLSIGLFVVLAGLIVGARVWNLRDALSMYLHRRPPQR